MLQIGAPRQGEKIRRRSLRRDFSLSEHDHIVCVLDLADQMRRPEHRDAAFPGEREHVGHQFVPAQRIETLRRLVEEEQLGIGQECTRQLDLAAGTA